MSCQTMFEQLKHIDAYASLEFPFDYHPDFYKSSNKIETCTIYEIDGRNDNAIDITKLTYIFAQCILHHCPELNDIIIGCISSSGVSVPAH